ncbi:MAG: MarR family transcriptional regulator [Candidatus Lokiarchaeota archaeon]|nr:MarR family transcriptional regulator [Candidatus Lokiarchaeota archaeon]
MVTAKVKEKVLSEIKKIDQNDLRILYLLRNLGPLRFTNIIEYSGLSRSTVSKYIKLHTSKNNVEKKIYRNNSKNIQEQRYFITDLGTEKLGEDDISYDESLYFSEINDLISNLSELKNFYKEISVAESIITDITRNIINMGENYFLIEQNRDLYLTLFYIYNNSVLTRDFKFEITEFCKHYNVKKLRIDFYVDRLLSSDLGLYMFSRGEDKFFFHREDVLGVSTIRLIKDNLINEIVELSIAEDKMISDLDLDKLAEEITENLLEMELIWDANESQGISGIKEPFEMLVEKMIIKNALEMGIPKTSLMDIALQSKKLLKAEGGKNSLYNIINNSERYEDLNLVSISESEETELFQSLKLLRGFCPKCGKTVLKNDLSNICVRCGLNFDIKELLSDIEAASELSVAYKIASLEEEKEIECPNPNCNYQIKLNWDVCPNCLTPIIKP